MRHSFAGLALAAAVVLLSSCREAKVESYRVAKETPKPAAPATPGNAPSGPFSGGAQMPAGGTMASTPVTTAGGESLKWIAPAQWKNKGASAMRKGSYAVTGDNAAEADLSITAFPGDVGGDLANVNRWRQQLQLAPLAEADLAANSTHLDVGGLHLTVVDFAGASQRTLGAIVPYNGSTWFFKLMGPADVVAKEKDAFMAFLKTIQQP